MSIIQSHSRAFLRRALSAAVLARKSKVERIADDLIKLSRAERNDYVILLRQRMGPNFLGPSAFGSSLQSASEESGVAAADPAAVDEKTAFSVKLEKFDAASKLKIVKEIRSITDLGLKEAKDLVEKAPAVVKKGVSKEEAEKIIEKLKAVGATVVLE